MAGLSCNYLPAADSSVQEKARTRRRKALPLCSENHALYRSLEGCVGEKRGRDERGIRGAIGWGRCG
jgi:hypothetical protein